MWENIKTKEKKMDTQNFNDLIKQGEEAREIGSLKKSLELFYEALDLTTNDADKAMVRAHLGLVAIKEGDWVLAEHQFELSYEYGKRAENEDRIIEAKRHMSTILLHKKKYAEALKQASEARWAAKEKKRTDLPWFTHGCVKVVLQMNTTKMQKFQWVSLEIRDLVSVWGKEKNKVAKAQWIKGLLKTIVQVVIS